MGKQVEVENGEICLVNSHGQMAIIPVKHAQWVKKKLDEGCNECIDRLIETLPDLNKKGGKVGV